MTSPEISGVRTATERVNSGSVVSNSTSARVRLAAPRLIVSRETPASSCRSVMVAGPGSAGTGAARVPTTALVKGAGGER
jgi:hypothetical protein